MEGRFCGLRFLRNLFRTTVHFLQYQEKACSLCHHLVAEGLVSFQQAKDMGLFIALEMLLPALHDLRSMRSFSLTNSIDRQREGERRDSEMPER